jgi:nuclear pore complex protein Nup188
VELCDFVKNSQELARSMVRVVETCLQENMETGLPAPIFTQILSRRAEFAFIIIRKLHQALPGSPLFSNVFKIALKATTSSVTEFRSALSSANMDYYRSLLRMLYISLTAFAKEEKHSSQLVFDVLDVLDLVVTKGFKDLAQSAHQYPNRANPQDIALVTGILQVSLRIKNLEEIHKGLIIHLQQSQTIRAATTLFSWAEKLAGENGDPVYGELAVLFLLELSSIPLTAELLAADNILELLMSTTLAASIAQGVTPASHPRLHAIWSRGLLPLALNLLANVGQRFGRPVVTFLKFFLPQIKTAIEGWQKPTTVVLPAVNEVLGISMMLAIVARMGGQQELQQINIDTTKLLDGIDYLLTHKNYLKSLVAATSVEEEEMLKGGEETPGGLVEKVITGLQTVHGLLQDTTVDE